MEEQESAEPGTNIAQVPETNGERELEDFSGSSVTVDYLSCLEEGPNTEPEDPVLARTDPLPTGNMDASTDTTMTTPEN